MSEFYVGRFIEETRRDFYLDVEACTINNPCLSRFAGLALIPVNAAFMIANVLAAVIDTILQIWHAFSADCLAGLFFLVVTPIALAIQIPAAILEGTASVVYDLFAAMFLGDRWANFRYCYHANVMEGYNTAPQGWWANISESSTLLC